MPYPGRFAGYDTPWVLLKDDALTREQKISALQSWRGAADRYRIVVGGDSPGQRRLIADIEQALAAVHAD
jgi:hypothetical protein